MELIKVIVGILKLLIASAYAVSLIVSSVCKQIHEVPVITYIPPVSTYSVPVDQYRQGTKGRLIFDGRNFSVALFECNEYNAQQFVDYEDSAAWFMWNGNQSPIIADHCTQGFDIICRCSIGDICHIVDGTDYQQYKCIGIDRNGINAGADLYLSTGYNFAWNNDPGYLYMYTCTKPGDSYHITVAIWEAVYNEEDLITIIDDDDEDLITIIDDDEEDLIPIIDDP